MDGQIQCVLVTGGAGFIGSNFVRFLLEQRPDVRVVNYDALTYAGNLANLEDIADDPRFAENAGRVEHRGELVELIAAALVAQPTEHWLDAFSGCGVPAGPINDLQQVFGDAHVIEQQLVRQLDHARAGQVPTIANPVAFSVTAVEYHRAPPVLGQHTNEVLRDLLGYSPEKIAALADDGAI